jgi:hypothetical protein
MRRPAGQARGLKAFPPCACWWFGSRFRRNATEFSSNTSRYPASSPNRGTPSGRAAVASIASRVASGSAFLTANSR